VIEALLTSTVALAAVMPLLLVVRTWASRLIAAVLMLLAFAVAVATFMVEEAPSKVLSARPLVKPGYGYVGSASCRSCHPGEHASWFDSYHRTMTQVVSREVMVDDFEELELDWFGKPVLL